MAEYIEREAAIANLTALEVTNPSATMTDAKRLLADMPAADVAPVAHGRWINQPLWGIGVCSCSNCKDKSQIFVFSNGEISEKFCPLCGARMDGDDDG